MATLEVYRGDAAADEIQDAWRAVLAEVAMPSSSARQLVQDFDADPDALATAPLTIEQSDGNEGLKLVIETLAPVAGEVLRFLWTEYVRPRIRKQTSRDAGPPVEDDA